MLYAMVDETGQTELKDEMTHTKDKKWYRRLKIIDLSSQGYAVPQLTNMFDYPAPPFGFTLTPTMKAA